MRCERDDNTHSPEEGGSNAEDHRASLMTRIPAVVHIPHHPAVGGHYGACSGGGNTQKKHCLAAQEFSDTGAQHLTAISLPVEEKAGRSCNTEKTSTGFKNQLKQHLESQHFFIQVNILVKYLVYFKGKII